MKLVIVGELFKTVKLFSSYPNNHGPCGPMNRAWWVRGYVRVIFPFGTFLETNCVFWHLLAYFVLGVITATLVLGNLDKSI